VPDSFARQARESSPGAEIGNRQITHLVESSAEGDKSPKRKGRSRSRSFGPALTTKPRRMSQSPNKQNSRIAASQDNNASMDAEQNIVLGQERRLRTSPTDVTNSVVVQENINPFQKRGLRRSPTFSQALETAVPNDSQIDNPFQKKGLRRSPVSSNPVEAILPIDGSLDGPEIIKASTFPVNASTQGTLLSVKQNTLQLQLASLEAVEPVSPSLPEQERLDDSGKQQEKRQNEPQAIEASPRQESQKEQQLILPAVIPTSPAHQGPEDEVRHTLEAENPKILPRTTQEEIQSNSQTMEPFTFPDKRQEGQATSPRPKRPSKVIKSTASRNFLQLEEPELPPTPTQLGLADPIVTTPPAGIHDTPSKRAIRGKALSQKLKSSPLKPRDGPPPKPLNDSVFAAQTESQKELIVQRRRATRFATAQDPHASKRQARDKLFKELYQLKKDVAMTNRENDRLRRLLSKKTTAMAGSQGPEGLMDVLLRSTLQNSLPQPAIEKTIHRSIGSFLPFTSRRRPNPVAPHLLTKPVQSHRPVDQKDPLIYLQIFSPLVYTSDVIFTDEQPLPGLHELEQATVRQHLINVSHPSGLFAGRLLMTVDSSVPSITSVSILRLPESAEKELGCFIKEWSRVDNIVSRDIGVICWAMGRWFEVSVLRSRFWCSVETSFGTASARAKSLQQNDNMKKRKRGQKSKEKEDALDDEENSDDEMRNPKWTRKQLVPHMGRTAMTISNDDVELRFEWIIGFDWTGEVENSISASAAVPKSCEFVRHGIYHWDS